MGCEYKRMWDASLRLGRERTDRDGEHALNAATRG